MRGVVRNRAQHARRGARAAGPTPRRATGSRPRSTSPVRCRHARGRRARRAAACTPRRSRRRRARRRPARRSRCTEVSPPIFAGLAGTERADAVEPDAARDLLDEVDLALEVGPPRRDDRGAARSTSIPSGVRRRLMSSSESSRRQDVVHRAGAHRRCAAARSASGTRRSRRARAAPTATSANSSIARGRAGRDIVGVDAAFEARARLRAQAEPLRRLGDARGLEVRRLEQDLRGRASDTSAAAPPMIPAMPCATRSASQIRRSSRLERALHAVERRHLLARLGQPHDDARARRAGRGRTRAADGSVRASRSW